MKLESGKAILLPNGDVVVNAVVMGVFKKDDDRVILKGLNGAPVANIVCESKAHRDIVHRALGVCIVDGANAKQPDWDVLFAGLNDDQSDSNKDIDDDCARRTKNIIRKNNTI